MNNLPYHTAKAVLLYRTTGQSEEYYGTSSGVCGPGEYAVLFDGDSADAENAAQEYLHTIKCTGWKIQEWKIICNVEWLVMNESDHAPESEFHTMKEK